MQLCFNILDPTSILLLRACFVSVILCLELINPVGSYLSWGQCWINYVSNSVMTEL